MGHLLAMWRYVLHAGCLVPSLATHFILCHVLAAFENNLLAALTQSRSHDRDVIQTCHAVVDLAASLGIAKSLQPTADALAGLNLPGALIDRSVAAKRLSQLLPRNSPACASAM